MLSDYWVISLLLIQLFSLALLFNALFFSIKIIQHWSFASSTESQIYLERRTYLISSIIRFVLFFQIVSLVVFLHTSNKHLPQIIKGAMCATGTLGINSFGYPTLFVKAGAILLYAAFLILNYFDNAEPSYPLTPTKYWLVLPVFLLISIDFYLVIQYFLQIEPDIIATCCSVSFLASKTAYFDLGQINKFSQNHLYLFFSLSLLLAFSQTTLLFIRKRKLLLSLLQTLLSIVFVYYAIFTLKYFFVKYIYGLPSHHCLFDIFWSKYYYLGYVIFGAYYGLLISTLLQSIYYLYQRKLDSQHQLLIRHSGLSYLAFLGLAVLLPSLYWWFWQGNL